MMGSRARGDPLHLQPGWSKRTDRLLDLAPSKSTSTSTRQLVVSFLSALIVVVANLALVTYVVAEASATQSYEYALTVRVPVHPVSRQATTDSPTPTTDLLAPSVTTASPSAETAVTQPPRTTSPTTTPPAPNLTSPPFVQHAVLGVTMAVPSSNIPPSPNFLSICGFTTYNDSSSCVTEVVAAIDNARAIEGVSPMGLPTNWTSLTPAEQVFVATNLERTVRGLAPLSAMASGLDAVAAQGAAAGTDPTGPSGLPGTWFGANWAGMMGNPLEAMYYWMYDDGLGSSNVDCSASNLDACWGHRAIVLYPLACMPCVMGAAWGTTAKGATSVVEAIVDARGSPAVTFTWAQEERYIS